MVVIKKRSNIIPVDFGEFTLEYRANDENIKRMEQLGRDLEKKAEKFSEVEDDKAFDELYIHTKAAWTELFDEAAFERVYAFSDNTTINALYYLIEAIYGIVTEFKARNSKETFQKYLD